MNEQDDTPFELPEKVIDQLSEFTRAFLLIGIDSEGGMFVHDNINNESDDLAIEKFLENLVMERKILDEQAIKAMSSDDDDED